MFCKRAKGRASVPVLFKCINSHCLGVSNSLTSGSTLLQICLLCDPFSLSAAPASPADTPSGTSLSINQTHLSELPLWSVYSLLDSVWISRGKQLFTVTNVWNSMTAQTVPVDRRAAATVWWEFKAHHNKFLKCSTMKLEIQLFW